MVKPPHRRTTAHPPQRATPHRTTAHPPPHRAHRAAAQPLQPPPHLPHLWAIFSPSRVAVLSRSNTKNFERVTSESSSSPRVTAGMRCFAVVFPSGATPAADALPASAKDIPAAPHTGKLFERFRFETCFRRAMVRSPTSVDGDPLNARMLPALGLACIAQRQGGPRPDGSQSGLRWISRHNNLGRAFNTPAAFVARLW
jgi:hypothetical protein